MPVTKRLDICRATDTRLFASIALTWLYDRLAEGLSKSVFDENGWFMCEEFSKKPKRKGNDKLAEKNACKQALEWFRDSLEKELKQGRLTYIKDVAANFLLLDIKDSSVFDTLMRYDY